MISQHKLESVPVSANHLKVWWDGQNAVVFCQDRQSLLAIDMPTILGLLGEEVKDEVVKNNLKVLTDINQPLPSLTTPAGFAADIEFLTPDIARTLFKKNIISDNQLLITTSWLELLISIDGESELLEVFKFYFSDLLDIQVQNQISIKNTMGAVSCVVVKLDKQQMGWRLQVNDNFVLDGLLQEQLAPMLMDIVMTAYYRSLPYAYAFHGAAIQWQHYNLFFAAESGKGKSTLTSYFANQQATVLSDEVICLNADFEPSQIRLPLTLKSGSWSFADELVSDNKQWNRGDGRWLKYYHPKWQQPSIGLKPVLCFPEFNPDAPESCCEVSPCKAIQTLALSGYELPIENRAQVIEKLLYWLEQIPVLSVSYHDRSNAWPLIEKYLNERS